MDFLESVRKKESAGPKGFIKENMTFQELVDKFIELHASSEWKSSGTHTKNIGRLDNYILPVLGEQKLKDISTETIERFYLELQRTKSIKTHEYMKAGTIDGIHKLLHSIFNYAIKYDYIAKNPCFKAKRPEYQPAERKVWEKDYLKRALQTIQENEDRQTILLINIAFAGSLRASELAGIKLSNITIDPINKKAKIEIKTNFVRVQREAYNRLTPLARADKYKKIYDSDKSKSTFMADATLKTKKSKRYFWLPRKITELLIEEMEYTRYLNNIFDTIYKDEDFLFLNYQTGRPFDKDGIASVFKRVIRKNGLKEISFHAIRHMSIEEKLKLSNGDIKSVQGDSGHSRAEMVLEQYSHVQDTDRLTLAQVFEDEFYNDTTAIEDKQVSLINQIRASYEKCKIVAEVVQKYPEIYAEIINMILNCQEYCQEYCQEN